MSLQKVTTFDLVMRKQILENLIKQNSDDPRVNSPGGPKAQLAIIEEELESRKNVKPQNKEDENGNLTVGLKSLKITSSNKLGT
ncbi:MAG: hypothetical protein ACW99Q_06795 [Candidatus Kariarchaeaceae archaeon]|jgi:hypothetical protein